MTDETPVGMTSQDEEDIHRLYSEPDGIETPTFHPVLEVWREVLVPIETEAVANITPQWATRIVTSFAGVTFADMLEFQERYFTKLREFRDILTTEIDGDPECLSYSTPEEDVEHNAHHYKNVMMLWQMALLQWELDWDTADPMAATELAAISEVHKMFFGNVGMTAYLDNIGLQFNDDDQAELLEALEGMREEK